jgi:hypothetical protein
MFINGLPIDREPTNLDPGGSFWDMFFTFLFFGLVLSGLWYGGNYAYDYYWDYQAEQAKIYADKIHAQIAQEERKEKNRQWEVMSQSQREDFPGLYWNNSGAGIYVTGGSSSGAGIMLKGGSE